MRLDVGEAVARNERGTAALGDRPDIPVDGRAIGALKKAAEGTDNVLYPLRDALRTDATLGEVCDALREVWGEYQPGEL